MKIGISHIVQCFEETDVVGTKVLDRDKFMEVLGKALAEHNPKNDTQEGQHNVELTDDAIPLVSCGVGLRTLNPDDYIVRPWRGTLQTFLTRERAADVTGVRAIVYTREAYGRDPEITREQFLGAFPDDETTHCVVAVLAVGGPKGKTPVEPLRFCRNLSGCNAEYDVAARLSAHMKELSKLPSKEGAKDGGLYPGLHHDSKRGLEEKVKYLESEFSRLKTLAEEVAAYWETWCVVAD